MSTTTLIPVLETWYADRSCLQTYRLLFRCFIEPANHHNTTISACTHCTAVPNKTFIDTISVPVLLIGCFDKSANQLATDVGPVHPSTWLGLILDLNHPSVRNYLFFLLEKHAYQVRVWRSRLSDNATSAPNIARMHAERVGK